ncbi:MAG: ABC transporter ATP-binding protein [Chloroflexota bacterium]
MSDIAIRVENLGKSYQINHQQGRSKYRTLQEEIVGLVSNPFRKTEGSRETVWALKDISFELKAGEALGIIGRNGAGKSTLLKILSRITRPTTGHADIYGRIGSLLEVGTGFHPELTGRENIFLNGAVLGMTRRDIQRRFDEIVAFAEIEKFLDTPVKRFSSGMYMRLAFSVAAHLEPEILVVDEVLAVGDAEFQKKCLGKMSDVSHEGRTVLFVSHNMAAIKHLCKRIIWLKQGAIAADGFSEPVISQYMMESAVYTRQRLWPTGIASPGVDEFKLYSIRMLNQHGEMSTSHEIEHGFSIEMEYEIFKRLPYCRIGWQINTATGIIVMEAYDSDSVFYSGIREPGRFLSRCDIPGHLLNTGNYLIDINAGIPNLKNLVNLENVLAFNIVDTSATGANSSVERGGIIRADLIWSQEKHNNVPKGSFVRT